MNANRRTQPRPNVSRRYPARLRILFALWLALAPLGGIAVPPVMAQEETQVIRASSAAARVFFSNETGDYYGRSAASGDANGDGLLDLFVTAGYAAPDGLSDAGRVTLYLSSESLFAGDEAWTFGGENSGDDLGVGRIAVGDLNLDGYDDLVVGAAGYDESRGRVYLFLGGPQGPAAEPDWTYTAAKTDTYLGNAAAIGDIDDDGLPDLLVGSSGEGASLLVWTGTGGLPATEPDQQREDNGVNIDLGDFNGDGILDAFVGGYGDDHAGTLSVYRGAQGGGLSLRPAWIARGEGEFDLLGYGLANAGDVNGDGLDDAVAGALLNGEEDSGRVYLFAGDSRRVRGPLEVEAASLGWSYSGAQPQGSLGSSVASVGDLDQDGYADVLVGEPGANEGAGSIHIFLGSAEGLGALPAWTITGENAGDYFGAFAATLGDLDGDGYTDFAVGAPGSDQARDRPGQLYMFRGGPEFGQTLGPDIPEPQTDLTWFPSQERAIEGEEGLAFGWPALIIGDVNGDGYDDLGVNSLGNPGAPTSGSVAVYYGEQRGVADDPSWEVDSDDWNAALDTSDLVYGGLALGPVGDVNGDGFDDLLVSPIDWVTPAGDAALVYYGGADGLGADPYVIRSPIEANETEGDHIFGGIAGPAGDVNGDGYADAVIVAFEESDDRWTLFVYAGGAEGLGSEPLWSTASVGISDQSLAFAAAGDTNGDGYDDLLVALPPRETEDADLPAQAFLYLGSADGPQDEPAWTLDTAPAEDDIPTSIAALGDVNGDGFGDVAVVAPYEPEGSAMVGRVLILFGDGANVDNGAPQSLALDLGEDAQFGAVVDGIGDVNGDGYADLLVGSPDFAEDNTIIWQILPGGGEPSGPGVGEKPLWEVRLLFDEPVLLAAPYYIAGDLNGDGYADVPMSDIDVGGVMNGDASGGQAIVYFGGPGVGSQQEPPVVDTGKTDEVPVEIAWQPSATRTFSGEAGEAFGWPALIAGDVNGDGYADVAVGSLGNPDLGIDGRVQVYYGSAEGVGETADWEATGDSWSELTGSDGLFAAFALGPMGDVNGDGFDDLLATAISFESEKAAILIFYGGEAGLSREPVELAPPYTDEFIFGLRLAPAGDVNGDGYADIAVLSYDMQEDEAVVWVYHGGAEGIGADPMWSPGDLGSLDSSPAFAAAGDIDGDGFGDFIMGYADQGEDARTLRLFLGSAEGLATTPEWTWTNDGEPFGPDLRGGVSVAGLGDVNGDGFADVAVAAPHDTNGGHVMILFGDGQSLDAQRSQIVQPELALDESFGIIVAAAGDANGDGYADLLTNGTDGEGGLLWHLLLGSEQGIVSEPVLTQAASPIDSDFTLLQTLAGGDVNGDGFDDFILSDVDVDGIMSGDLETGQATLYYGAANKRVQSADYAD